MWTRGSASSREEVKQPDGSKGAPECNDNHTRWSSCSDSNFAASVFLVGTPRATFGKPYKQWIVSYAILPGVPLLPVRREVRHIPVQVSKVHHCHMLHVIAMPVTSFIVSLSG